jgi:putative tryptophan/tyrosine transport system substrate-binding protein
MRRREFITLIGSGAAVWPIAARAEQAARFPRIGLLSPFSPVDTALWHQAFLRGLLDLGWVDGKNVAIELDLAGFQNAMTNGATLIHGSFS